MSTDSSLIGGIENLISNTEALLKSTASATSDGIDEIRQKLSDSLSKARGQSTKAKNYAVDIGKNASSQADQLVRENPWQSIAVAALLGLIAGIVANSPRQ